MGCRIPVITIQCLTVLRYHAQNRETSKPSLSRSLTMKKARAENRERGREREREKESDHLCNWHNARKILERRSDGRTDSNLKIMKFGSRTHRGLTPLFNFFIALKTLLFDETFGIGKSVSPTTATAEGNTTESDCAAVLLA